MASIRDVAKKANVSPATVSRVLNRSGYVSENAKSKTIKAMIELDYTPNELARNLFHKKTKIIGVLVPDVAHPFFSQFVKYVEAELYEYGYKTMICDTTKEHNSEVEYLDMLNRHIVDGIITGVHSLSVEEYLKIKKPIVALDRYLGDSIPIVGVDHKKGGKLAAEKLISCGCKHVIQFQGFRAVKTPSHERHEEFARVMKENNILVHSYELEWNRFDSSYFQNVVHKIFQKYPGVDGMFGTDLLAIFCLKEALRHNKRVPEDIKIIAYDGTYVTELMNPSITAIVQPIQELAKECVSLVLKLADGKIYKNKRVILDVKLHEGQTT